MKKVLISTLLSLMLFILSVGLMTACDNSEPVENKKTFSSVVFNDITMDYDGEEHTIIATGVPEGATVTYTNEGPYILPGSYDIGVTIEAEGYNSCSKTATLTINALDFASVEFTDSTLDYDGKEHTIIATGVPEGATVTYTNEGPYVNAGAYIISVNVSAQGFNPYTKSAKLTINKIDFPLNITFNDEKTIYTGGEKTILVSGELPEGTQTEYKNNKGTQAGEYNASVTLKNPNYNTKTLYATLKIFNVINTAKNIMDVLLQRPEAWSFMPDAFLKENLASDNDPSLDFTKFVNVNSINKKFVGKQMFVLWEGLQGMDTLLEKFDVVFAMGETIVAAYQTFINDNPEDYAEWTKNISGFKIKILLNGSESELFIGNNVFSMELFADTTNNVNRGRIDVLSGGKLSYEMKEDYLKFNIGLTIKGALVMKQVEFIRTDDSVSGYFYEYAGLEDVAVKTSAVIAFNEEYAIVASAKRENEDLLINGYEEVYSSKTGEFLAAEVIENNKLVEFDTYWVNLFDIKGINNLKAVANGDLRPDNNQHDVYLNNSSSKFEPAYNKILGVNTSRKFDIEMKTVYYVVKTNNGDDVNYSIIETEIPMLFVQSKNVEAFSTDIKEENEGIFIETPSLPQNKMAIAKANINSFVETLKVIKETLTYQELEKQIGERDSFFNETV